LLLIGFLMVAWTKKKQGLHDKLAHTLVVRRSGRWDLSAEERAGVVLGTKVCPRCAETVKEAAQVCRFCGFGFEKSPAPPAR